MRRSSVSNDEIVDDTGRNIDDLIYKFDNKSDKRRLQQLFSTPSPQLQRDLEMFYDREQNRGVDAMVQREILRRLILKQKTDSLLSLTDSEICSDDQSRVDSDGGGVVRDRFYQCNLDNDDTIVGKEQVAYSLSRVGRLLDMLSRLPWPRMSFTALGICFLGAIFISPRACVQNILFPAFRLVFGTLYPAYASYKAVRTKNVKEYVKWMMYWIVYAFFTCIETFTDIFLSWFPFYYEVKVLVVLWLLSPATKGSSVLYRKFVHPMLTRREQEIDDYLNQAKERGYTAVIQLGSKGVNYATNVIMQTALKGGGNLVQTIRRSYSLSDLSEPDVHRTQDEIDEITRQHQQNRILRQRNPNPVTRSSSGSRHSTGMYFSEIDVTTPKGPIDNLNYNIRSSEDISSGYSSAEPVSGGLSRTSSMTSANKLRFRAKRAEDEHFSENDENEYLRKASLSSQYPQNIYDPNNPLPSPPPVLAYSILSNTSSSPKLIRPIPRLLSNDIVDDWNDENLFENEKYYQTSSLSNIDKEINVSPKMKEKYEMFCQWLENNKEMKNEPSDLGKNSITKQISDDDFKDTISVNSDEGLEKFIDIDSSNDKIEMKIENKKSEREEKAETAENINNFTVSEPAIQPISSEIFLKISQEHENIIKNDELEVKNNESLIENNESIHESVMGVKNDNAVKFEPFAKVIVQDDSLNENELQEKSQENFKLEFQSPKKVHDYEEINFSHASLSELKRPVYHSKGKAPVPPTPLFPQSIPLSRPILPSISSSAALILESESHIAKSRSPSPKPEASKIKPSKKSLFRSYLPSIFRSESPKPIQTKSDDDYHRETEI